MRRVPFPITQKAFDGDSGHLHRLAALTPGQPAAPADLWAYTQDLRYTDIDVPLLEHLLRTCLQAWYEDLRGTHGGYGGFVENFYPALADRHVFDTLLNPSQTAAASAFMRRSIIEEIDDQRGLAYGGKNARPHRWINALTTYGVLFQISTSCGLTGGRSKRTDAPSRGICTPTAGFNRTSIS